MKIVSAFLILIATTFCLQAQSFIVVTNAASIETISNGMVVANTPIVQLPPLPMTWKAVLASPAAFLALLLWALPYILRAYHAYQLGASTKGVIAAVALGTNVPKAMVVQGTNQPVVPASPVNPSTTPKV